MSSSTKIESGRRLLTTTTTTTTSHPLTTTSLTFPSTQTANFATDVKPSANHAEKRGKHGETDDVTKPQKLGDLITADHAIFSEEEVSRRGDKNALIVQDRYSTWLQGYALPIKSAYYTQIGLRQFMGPKANAVKTYTDGANAGDDLADGADPGYAYTDGSKEFKIALEDLGWCHDTCTHYCPQTNGVAEGAERRVKEGKSCALNQSGWAVQWWPEAMACYCFLRNIADAQKYGFTAYQSRFL